MTELGFKELIEGSEKALTGCAVTFFIMALTIITLIALVIYLIL